MGDKIQLTIENMITELDVLVEKELLSKLEAKKILKKRSQHEYSFEKKNATATEFYKAIQYEKVLESRLKAKKAQLKAKDQPCDFHCTILNSHKKNCLYLQTNGQKVQGQRGSLV